MFLHFSYAEPGITGDHQGGVRREAIGGTRGGEEKNTFKWDKNTDVCEDKIAQRIIKFALNQRICMRTNIR